jgi:tRNA-specific 2-thiouridylase
MSGGVDSSLTAALLMEQGYDVVGVHMRLHHLYAQSRTASASGRLNKGCCSADDVDDARMVCYELGIPFYVLDFEGDFRRTVIDNFVEEYAKGRTPYPCLMCNRYVKFDALLKRAAQLESHRRPVPVVGQRDRGERSARVGRSCRRSSTGGTP